MKLKNFLKRFETFNPELEVLLIDRDDSSRIIDLDKTMRCHEADYHCVIQVLSTHTPDSKYLG